MTGMTLIYNAHDQAWWYFHEPIQVIKTSILTEVLPLLDRIDQKVKEGFYAVGFLSYEAAPALDPAFSGLIQHHPWGSDNGSDFPLIWFGLYPDPELLTLQQFASLHPKFASLHPIQPYHLGSWKSSITFSQFEDRFNKIKAYIAQGETYQVNYSYRLQAQFSGDPYHLFLDLVQAQQHGYPALLDLGKYVICSASPELFLTQTGTHLQAKPMKGTAPRSLTSDEDQQQAEWLKQSSKNRAENIMIVDMIRNDLGRIARWGSVHVPDLFRIERYPTLWQMTSTVTAESDCSFRQVIQSLFPCASITGAPKVRTMEIIAELESTPRKVYTGSIGYITPTGLTQFNVAIRTLLIDQEAHSAEYGIGSGITWESDCDQEYQECQVKATILNYKCPMFSLLETLRWDPDQGYFLFNSHLDRLQASAEYFDIPLDGDQLKQDLLETACAFDQQSRKIRILVHQDGRWDLELSLLHSQLCLNPNDLKPSSNSSLKINPCQARLSYNPVDRSDRFLYHKTTHRQIYDQALQSHAPCEDVLLWNRDHELTEYCFGNLVVEIEDQYFTPPVSCGLLPGTFRSYLLNKGQIKEQTIKLDQLASASHLFLINSVRGWQLVQLLTMDQ